MQLTRQVYITSATSDCTETLFHVFNNHSVLLEEVNAVPLNRKTWSSTDLSSSINEIRRSLDDQAEPS